MSSVLRTPLAPSFVPSLLLAGCLASPLVGCSEREVQPPITGGERDAGTTAEDDAGGNTGADASGETPDSGVTEPQDSGEPADTGGSPDAEPARGLAVLGNDRHTVDAVRVTELTGSRLRVPRDLAFNPSNPGELWVVNRADDSTVTWFEVGTPNERSLKRIDPYALHFMEEPSSIAFGAVHPVYGHMFATCQESRNTYNNQAAANDFMGPALWPSTMEHYAISNPEAVRANGFDLGSHLDMLHETPWCMGIAWDHDNVYWTFDGLTNSISRYDFQEDHAPGYDDHSDGIIRRYVVGEVSRVANVPSHIELDRQSALLYIADTGNARIAVLDTTTGVQGASQRVKEPGTSLRLWTGASLTTLVDGAAGELQRPSGLAMVGDILFVGDNANGRISAFDKHTGERLDYLDTGIAAGNLMGIESDGQGSLYIVDAGTNRVLRISPL